MGLRQNPGRRRCALTRHLSLARTGGSAVGLGASGAASRLAVGLGRSGASAKVGKRSLGHAAQGLAGGRGAALLVSGEVEGDEEHQVGAEDGDAGEGSKLLASAGTSVGHVGEVGRGEVGVRGEVDEACNGLAMSHYCSHSAALCTYQDQ